MLIPFLVGLFIGFVMCIPIGPINVWVMNTYLKHNQTKALAIAAGGSTMDFVYFSIILSGLSLVTFNPQMVLGFKVVGILVIILLGVKELRVKTIEAADLKVEEDRRAKWMKGPFSYFVLGVIIYTANPTLIVTMSGLGAFVKSLELFTFSEANILSVSVGLAFGSFSWFYFLIFLVKKFEEVIRNKYIHKFSLISGALMVGLGIFMGGQLIWSH